MAIERRYKVIDLHPDPDEPTWTTKVEDKTKDELVEKKVVSKTTYDKIRDQIVAK
jgi:hypothetical protein